MILALTAAGLLLVAMPGLVAASAAKRVPPREWTRLALAALALGTGAVLVALALAAVPAVASVVEVPGIVDHCRGALAPLAADPTVLSWVAGGAAVAMLVALARGSWYAICAARRARVEPWLGHHEARADFDLVVVPTRELVAFGVPGSPPQVIVSQGVVDDFDAAETDAIIEHEVAHHRLRHWHHLVVLAGLERVWGWFGPVERGIESARSALEAWADDESGAADGPRRESLRRARWSG